MSLTSVSLRVPRDSGSDAARILVENYENFKRSGLPNRIMVYSGEGVWMDLGGEELEGLKLGFWEGKAVVEAEIWGYRYLFDFVRMLRIEFESGRRSSIAWIDVDGKCFFPKSFIFDELEDVVDEEESGDVKIKIGLNLGKRKRDSDSESEFGESSDGSQSNNGGDLLVNKPGLGVANVDDECKWPGCRLVKEEWRGYDVVKNLFMNGLKFEYPDTKVASVYQCCRIGDVERAREHAFRRQVEVVEVVRGKPNVVFAWFGTSAEGVRRILAHGFGGTGDVKECYGVGVHLCPVSSRQISAMHLEADENGEKHVILCRVLLGNVEKVEAGSKQSRPSSVYFDNGVDDLEKSKHYIVWCANMNTHILPECVVSFKSSGTVSGQMGGHEGRRHGLHLPKSPVPLSAVISKLADHLPSEKINAIRQLSSECKAGRVSRETLVKGVRNIASDPILKQATLSAYQEFNNKKMRL